MLTHGAISLQVVLTFEEPQGAGTTVVKLVQKEVPKEDQYGNGDVVESTARGWQQQIFRGIRAVFGYGM